jgi:hypothetical protein
MINERFKTIQPFYNLRCKKCSNVILKGILTQYILLRLILGFALMDDTT